MDFECTWDVADFVTAKTRRTPRPAPIRSDAFQSALGVRAERAIRADERVHRDIGPHLEQWVRRLIRVELWVEANGRLPYENNRRTQSEEAVSLAFWIRYQRRLKRAERLSTFQRSRLESLDGFTWEPSEERWERAFADYREFLATHRRAPRGRSNDPEEVSLAAWMAKQRLNARNGRLDPDRVRRINSPDVWPAMTNSGVDRA